MIQAMIIGFIVGIISNITTIIIKDKILKYPEKNISKPKDLATHASLLILFIILYFGIIYLLIFLL